MMKKIPTQLGFELSLLDSREGDCLKTWIDQGWENTRADIALGQLAVTSYSNGYEGAM
jgi:hypothetical protein